MLLFEWTINSEIKRKFGRRFSPDQRVDISYFLGDVYTQAHSSEKQHCSPNVTDIRLTQLLTRSNFRDSVFSYICLFL